VAVGIREHHPTDIALPDGHSSSSEGEEAVHLRVVIGVIARGQVDVQRVLTAPEVPDRMRTLAGDDTEESAAGKGSCCPAR
jgi:hypothetical protein